MSEQPVFGIDLGTTNTVVACSESEGSPTVVDIRNSHSTSSVIAFNKDTFTVGNEVDMDPLVNPPSQIIRMVKRIMGVGKQDFDNEKSKYSMLQYEIVEDDDEDTDSHETVEPLCSVAVQYRGKKQVFRPETISGLLLAMIKRELTNMYNMGDAAPYVVISVPAYFNTVQRRATEAAGQMAGFNVLRVVNEPTAGAFAYALHEKSEEERRVIVYDFGGGTFDCTTLVRRTVNGEIRMQVCATKGDHILGGEDIDEEIVCSFLLRTKKELEKKMEVSKVNDVINRVRSNPSLMTKLRKRACEVKETMTKRNLKQVFKLPELEDIVDPFFTKTEEIVDEVIDSSGWEGKPLTDLVLLGGSSKLSTIQHAIRAKFPRGVKVHSSVNPDNAVALGAAAVARQAFRGSVLEQRTLKNPLDKYHLQDRTSYSIGVEVSDGSVQRFVRKHTNVPDSGSTELMARKNRKEVKLAIFEGDGRLAIENRQIGVFYMEDETLHKEGARFVLEWRIDENFDLHLTAVDEVQRKRKQDDGEDGATVERKKSLRLIGLNEQQIARRTLHIRKMMKRHAFIGARDSLETELQRLSSCLSNTVVCKDVAENKYVDETQKWIDQYTKYSEANHEAVTNKRDIVMNLIKLVKKAANLERTLKSFDNETEIPEEYEAAKSALLVIKTVKSEGLDEEEIQKHLKTISDKERQVRCLVSRKKRRVEIERKGFRS